MPFAIAVRLMAIVAAAVAARNARLSRWMALTGSAVASALTMKVGIASVGSGQSIEGLLLRHHASGIALDYSVTPLSGWFLMVLGLIAIPIALYSTEYFEHAVVPSRTAVVGIAFNVLLGAVEVVFVANSVMAFLFAWELMTLSTAALVATDHHDRVSRRAAYLYLVMSHIGTGCLVAGLLGVSAIADASTFPLMFAGSAAASPWRDWLFGLFFIGFGVKAGLVPLHVWLPEAHPAAPSSVSALMSAVLITTGIYGLVRVCVVGLGIPTLEWGLAFMAIGTVSAILGVLYALTQNDVKRLLAYSTIENAGIITTALGVAMVSMALDHRELATVAVVAALVHVLNHAVFKSLLFLGAGGVVMTTGTRQLEHYGGLLRRMPWTGLFFLVGALAISGVPLLNGFTSEWLAFQALLLSFASTSGLVRLNFPLAGAALALTSALAAACFVRLFGIGFLAMPRSPQAGGASESPAMMLMPQAFLAGSCVALGLFPGVVIGALTPMLATLPGLDSDLALAQSAVAVASAVPLFDRLAPAALGAAFLVSLGVASALSRSRGPWRRVPTWGCGGTLTERTEYTATAFSKPLTMVFRAVYRPTREVESLAEVSPYFPSEVRYRSRVEPTFERFVYRPLIGTVLRAAQGLKVLQAGSLHAYLGYVLLLGVLLLLWLGGPA